MYIYAPLKWKRKGLISFLNKYVVIGNISKINNVMLQLNCFRSRLKADNARSVISRSILFQ